MRAEPRGQSSRAAVWVGPLALGAALLAGCPGDDDAPRDAGADAGADAGDPFHDPLSMPEEPTLSLGDFAGAGVCGTCHVTHHAQWRTSMHAYAMIDPVYRALVRLRQVAYDGTQDQFCTQCHSAIGTRGGAIVDGFSFEDLPRIALEGVTCEACHKVAELSRPYNSGHVLDPTGPIRGPIRDPIANPAHESAYSELHESSAFCAGCHDVLEVSGVQLERPYEEWLESPAAAAGRNCQSCHMPTYTGRATEDAPERTLHSHRFVGVDVPLTDSFATPAQVAAIREDVVSLLATAAELRLDLPTSVVAGEQLDLVVTIRNLIDAHNLPTGSTFNRQVWLEVVVRDSMGMVLYETGTLDANGDLRDHWSALDPYGDDDLVVLGSSLVDSLGEPVLFPWRAAEHSLRAIPPLLDRTHTLFVPTALVTTGPLDVQARLRFRSHPPFLLRLLGLEDLLSRVEIHDVATASGSVEVVAP